MIRIFQLWQLTEAGWRRMPEMFYGEDERTTAKAKLREYREKYGKDSVVLRVARLPKVKLVEKDRIWDTGRTLPNRVDRVTRW